MQRNLLPVLILLTLVRSSSFGQTTAYPFVVKKTGQGSQSILFIPGFASSGDVWQETTDVLEKTFTCYTLTMAGFAGVTPQPDPTFDKWATAIARYIEDNKINKPILIGHSMGGGLALSIAADHPTLIEKVIVVDAVPYLSALMNPVAKVNPNNDCTGIEKQLMPLSNDQFYQMQRMSIPRLLADTTRQNMVVDWSMKSDRKTFADMYCSFSNTDLREKIQTIQCPVLVLLEAYFTNIKPTIEAQYKGAKTAQFAYADKGLHFIMYDDRDWYMAQITTFLSGR